MSRPAARELSLSLRYACARAERPLAHFSATSFFTRSNVTLHDRRAFHQGRIVRQVEPGLEGLPEAEPSEVDEEEDFGSEEDALEGTEKEDASITGDKESDTEEEEEGDEDTDSDSDIEYDEPWSDYTDLEGSYTPTSFDGISSRPFPLEIKEKLLVKVDPQMVEIKPDGHLYLPEIQYRRILNNAFGPGGWALMPRTPLEYDPNTHICSREYALYAFGRFISQAGGEQPVSETVSPTTASEAAKSQALMRCCKDLGVASELWEPTFIREWKKVYAVQEWYEHVKTGKKTLLWRRRDRVLGYPYKESPPMTSTPTQAAPTRSSSYGQQQQQQQPSYGQQSQRSYGQQADYAQQAQPSYGQQPSYSQAPPPRAPKSTAHAPSTPPPPPPPPPSARTTATPPPAAPNVPPASRPTLYTPYKSYATRASTSPLNATRPVHAPKPIPGSPAAASALGGLGGEGDEQF